MTHLKCELAKYGQEQTTPEAYKAGSAMAKTFIFAWRSSHPLQSRFGRKPSPVPNRKASSRREDAMIRACFLEQCQSWKRWPHSSFAIMRCGTKRLVVGRSDA
jgi:hypothetical protein